MLSFAVQIRCKKKKKSLILVTYSFRRYRTITKQALCKWGQVERAKPILKILLVLWVESKYVSKEFKASPKRYVLWDFVGQRSAKLLSIKLQGWSHHPGYRTWAAAHTGCLYFLSRLNWIFDFSKCLYF